MVAYLNKVFLVGNLTKDPELRYTPQGVSVCDMRIAVTRRFTSNGEQKSETCFIDIVVWQKLAERCAEFLKKGSTILVDGRLQLDEWQTQDGQKRSKMRIVAENIQFLSRRTEVTSTEKVQADSSQESDLPPNESEVPF